MYILCLALLLYHNIKKKIIWLTLCPCERFFVQDNAPRASPKFYTFEITASLLLLLHTTTQIANMFFLTNCLLPRPGPSAHHLPAQHHFDTANRPQRPTTVQSFDYCP